MPKILVVDDSWLSRQRIIKMLRVQSHEVLEATNGQEGLEKVQSDPPDFIILNLLMPVMSGVEFLEALRAVGSDIPVIVLSADIPDSSRAQCLKLGVTGFLNTPLNEQELLDLLTSKTTSTMSQTNKEDIENLRSLVEKGVHRGAKVLNEMLTAHIELSIPDMQLLMPAAFRHEMQVLAGDGVLAAVDLAFFGAFSGAAQLLFPTETTSKLVAALIGDEQSADDLDSIRVGTLSEVGNIVLNGVMGTIGNILELHFNYHIPEYREGRLDDLIDRQKAGAASVLLARTRFSVETLQIEGEIVLFFDEGTCDALLEAIRTSREKSHAGP